MQLKGHCPLQAVRILMVTIKILRRFVVWSICHELYFCVDYWNCFQSLGNIYYIKSQESHTLVVNVMLIGVLKSTMAQFPFIIIYVQVLTKLSVNLSLCAWNVIMGNKIKMLEKKSLDISGNEYLCQGVPERGSLKGVQVSVLTRIGMIMHWHALFYSLFWKNIYMRFCSIKLFNFVTEHGFVSIDYKSQWECFWSVLLRLIVQNLHDAQLMWQPYNSTFQTC